MMPISQGQAEVQQLGVCSLVPWFIWLCLCNFFRFGFLCVMQHHQSGGVCVVSLVRYKYFISQAPPAPALMLLLCF